MQSSQTSLANTLEIFRSTFLERLPSAERRLFGPAIEATRRDLLTRKVPQPGSLAPEFELPDQHGRLVRLVDRLRHGPLVLLFVRGAWCPFCTLTLRAYQAALPAIHEAGGDLLAITPQPASTCSQMAERDLLAFETLSDRDNRTAAAYDIAFDIDPTLRPMHLRLGHDLPRLNGTGNWTVPLPATFVIGQDRKILLTHVEPGQYQRLEPSDALAAIIAARRTEPLSAELNPRRQRPGQKHGLSP